MMDTKWVTDYCDHFLLKVKKILICNYTFCPSLTKLMLGAALRLYVCIRKAFVLMCQGTRM